MNLFNQIMGTVKKAVRSPDEFNALDHCLSIAGVDPNNVRPGLSGIPLSVLMGCKKEVVMIPGTQTAARDKDGNVLMRKDKRGRSVPVMQTYGMTRKEWKARVQMENRKAESRWYSGEPQSSIDARKKKAA